MEATELKPGKTPVPDRRVPASRKVLDALRRNIGKNARRYLTENGHSEIVRDNVVRAAESLLGSMRGQAASGTVSLGLGDYGTFRAWVGYADRNRRKELGNDAHCGLTKASEKIKKKGPLVVRLTGRGDEDGDEKETGLEGTYPDASTSRTPLEDPEGYRRLATLLIPRILRVLGQREKSGLSPNQVETMWVLLAVETRDVEIPADVLDLVETFQPGLNTWQADLARAQKARAQGLPVPDAKAPGYVPVPVDQGPVTQGIARARRLIRTCLYLFVTLAPFGSAVYEEEEMQRLMDCVFKSGRVLDGPQCTLLQKAGSCLTETDVDYRVDTAALYSAVHILTKFNAYSKEQIIEQLHGAERKYAIQVPGQDPIRPRFDCVIRCAAHTYES